MLQLVLACSDEGRRRQLAAAQSLVRDMLRPLDRPPAAARRAAAPRTSVRLYDARTRPQAVVTGASADDASPSAASALGSVLGAPLGSSLPAGGFAVDVFLASSGACGPAWEATLRTAFNGYLRTAVFDNCASDADGRCLLDRGLDLIQESFEPYEWVSPVHSAHAHSPLLTSLSGRCC